MLNVTRVIERVREVIEPEYNKIVLDKNIAYELGISASKFATIKFRGTLPYDELILFCVKRHVNTNWLFFGVGQMEIRYA